MPLRLAVETAFPTVSVALDANGTLLEPGIDLSARRAAGLHAAVADLVHQADATVKNLDEVWVDVGPGSYTGLRVGIALVRTLAELVDVEIKTLRSTDQLARAVQGQMADHADFVVCLDARRNRWYCARYRVASDGLELVEAPTCLTPEELHTTASGAEAVVTNGAAPPLDLPVIDAAVPSAGSLFELAHLARVDPEPAPIYLMAPV